MILGWRGCHKMESEEILEEFSKFSNEKFCLDAVQKNVSALQYVHNPTEKVILAAVQQNGDALQYVHNPSEEVIMVAVGQDGNALRYVHNPSENVYLMAVKQNKEALRYIHDLEMLKRICEMLKAQKQGENQNGTKRKTNGIN